MSDNSKEAMMARAKLKKCRRVMEISGNGGQIWQGLVNILAFTLNGIVTGEF